MSWNRHLGSLLACSASQKSHVPLRSWHLHSNLPQAGHDSLLALRHTRPAPPHQHHCDDRAYCICLSASYTTYGERAARAGNCFFWHEQLLLNNWNLARVPLVIQAAYVKFVQQFDLLRRQLRSFAGTSKLSHTACVYTQNTYTQCFYKWQAFTHTHRKLFKQRSFYTQLLFYTQQALTQRIFYTQQAFTHSKRLHTELTHSAFTHGKHLLTQKLLHRDAFTHREAFTHSKLLHTKSFTHSKLLQKKNLTQRSVLVHNHNRNCSSQTGSRRQSDKKTILKHFLKGILKRKLLAPKLKKSADKWL